MKFKDIPNYEGIYKISDSGVIKSLQRIIIRKNGVPLNIKGRTLKYETNRNGYLQVTLYSDKGEKKLWNVHRLVAISFLGSPKDGQVVNHKDRNKTNNNLSNLEYLTHRENTVHALDKTKTSSKYVGVRWINNKWSASKTVGGHKYFLGYFKNEEDARDKYLNFNGPTNKPEIQSPFLSSKVY